MIVANGSWKISHVQWEFSCILSLARIQLTRFVYLICSTELLSLLSARYILICTLVCKIKGTRNFRRIIVIILTNKKNYTAIILGSFWSVKPLLSEFVAVYTGTKKHLRFPTLPRDAGTSMWKTVTNCESSSFTLQNELRMIAVCFFVTRL